jgi:hypothetical protein
LRPASDGEKVTGLHEALTLSMTTPSLILGYSILIALALRKLWFSVLICILWGAWALHLLLDQIGNEPLITAQKIGCIGSTVPYLLIGSALCTAMLCIIFIYRRP